MFSTANRGSRLANFTRQLSKLTTPCEAVIEYSTPAKVGKKESPFKEGLTKHCIARVALNFHLDPSFVRQAIEAGYNIDGPAWTVNHNTNPLTEHHETGKLYCRYRLLERLSVYFEDDATGQFCSYESVRPWLKGDSDVSGDPLVTRQVSLENLAKITVLRDGVEVVEPTE